MLDIFVGDLEFEELWVAVVNLDLLAGQDPVSVGVYDVNVVTVRVPIL